MFLTLCLIPQSDLLSIRFLTWPLSFCHFSFRKAPDSPRPLSGAALYCHDFSIFLAMFLFLFAGFFANLHY